MLSAFSFLASVYGIVWPDRVQLIFRMTRPSHPTMCKLMYRSLLRDDLSSHTHSNLFMYTQTCLRDHRMYIQTCLRDNVMHCVSNQAGCHR